MAGEDGRKPTDQELNTMLAKLSIAAQASNATAVSISDCVRFEDAIFSERTRKIKRVNSDELEALSIRLTRYSELYTQGKSGHNFKTFSQLNEKLANLKKVSAKFLDKLELSGPDFIPRMNNLYREFAQELPNFDWAKLTGLLQKIASVELDSQTIEAERGDRKRLYKQLLFAEVGSEYARLWGKGKTSLVNTNGPATRFMSTVIHHITGERPPSVKHHYDEGIEYLNSFPQLKNFLLS